MMASGFSTKYLDQWFQRVFISFDTTVNQFGSYPAGGDAVDWPSNNNDLWLGLCSYVNTSDPSDMYVPGYSAGIAYEPDCSKVNIGGNGNGYYRRQIRSYQTPMWEFVSGQHAQIQNKSQIVFTHTANTNSTQEINCGSLPENGATRAGLPWGYCSDGTWTALQLKYFYISEYYTNDVYFLTDGIRTEDMPIICYGELPQTYTMNSGDTLTFAAGSLRLSLAGCS